MNISKTLLTAVLGLALSAVAANAQLLLQTATGSFTAVTAADGVAVNGGPNASSTFTTPNPDPSVTIVSNISVPANYNFSDTGLPSTELASWTIDKTGALAAGYAASFSYTIDLQFDGGLLSLVYNVSAFRKDAVFGDQFSYTITPPSDGLFTVGGQNYIYSLSTNGLSGNVYTDDPSPLVQFNAAIAFVPVPEPSTYALFGVGALGAIVGYRRMRNKKLAA